MQNFICSQHPNAFRTYSLTTGGTFELKVQPSLLNMTSPSNIPFYHCSFVLSPGNTLPPANPTPLSLWFR